MFKGQHHKSRKSLSLLLTLEHAYCKKSQLLRGTFCFTQVQGPNALTTLLHLADEICMPKSMHFQSLHQLREALAAPPVISWTTMLHCYTSRFLLTSYVGLISRSTAVATASLSTVEGTMRVIWRYCDRRLRSYCTCSSCRVPSQYPQRSCNLQ